MSHAAMAVVSDVGYCVGIDLGDRKSNYCFLDAKGNIVAEGTLVTTHAELSALFSSIPKCRIAIEVGTHAILESLQSPKLGRMEFRCADGRIIERELGLVIGRYDSRNAGLSVVFGEDGDQSIIGVTTLGVLGLAVDPIQQKLIPTIGLAL